MLEPGKWQGQARAAEFVVRLAQPTLSFGTAKRAALYERESALMDTNLLKGLDPRIVKRVIYVSGACYYGNLGVELCDETAKPHPSGLGRLAIGGMERVGVYLRDGLPIVVAFPGTVYGPGSWFREMILTPLRRGKRLITISGHSPFVSPISVQDCSSAIAHLLTHGAIGERYFMVDDKPVQWATLQALAAEPLQVRPRFLTVPRWLVPVFMGRMMAENLLKTDNVLSNAKLKSLDFELQHSTVDSGIPATVDQFRKLASSGPV